MPTPRPVIGIIMGSDSDWPVMQKAAEVCDALGVECELRVLSAHRTPEETRHYAVEAVSRGLRVLIAGAGGAAHLPGVIASLTTLPVIGVPIATRDLNGIDSLLAIVQMPRGVPVATVGIGRGDNAALLAIQILALADDQIAQRLTDYRAHMAEQVKAADRKLQDERGG